MTNDEEVFADRQHLCTRKSLTSLRQHTANRLFSPPNGFNTLQMQSLSVRLLRLVFSFDFLTNLFKIFKKKDTSTILLS